MNSSLQERKLRRGTLAVLGTVIGVLAVSVIILVAMLLSHAGSNPPRILLSLPIQGANGSYATSFTVSVMNSSRPTPFEVTTFVVGMQPTAPKFHGDVSGGTALGGSPTFSCWYTVVSATKSSQYNFSSAGITAQQMTLELPPGAYHLTLFAAFYYPNQTSSPALFDGEVTVFDLGPLPLGIQ